MKKKIIIALLPMLFLMGCKEQDNRYEHPIILEKGRTTLYADDVQIEVPQAQVGLQGYEIVETDNGIDVILHYNKKE